MESKHFAILVAVTIFLCVIELIRRQKMTFRYSLFWLLASIGVLTLAIWQKLLEDIASFLGFQIVSNFVFFLLLSFFTFLTLLLTIYINEQNTKTLALTQALSALEYQINRLKNDLKR